MFQSSHANQHKSMQYESTLQCNSLLKIIFNYSISNLFRKAWRAEMHGWMVKHCRGWQVWPKKYFISTFTTHCPVSTPHPLLTQLWPLHCNALWSFPRLCICCHWCQVMRGEHQVPSCPSAKCHLACMQLSTLTRGICCPSLPKITACYRFTKHRVYF